MCKYTTGSVEAEMSSSRKQIVMLMMLLVGLHWHQHHVSAAKILALVVTPSRSHHIWNRSLMLALAAKGHQVTVVSPDPEKKPVPNHRDIVLEGMYEEVTSNFDYEAMSRESYTQNVYSIYDWGLTSCRKGLFSKGSEHLMNLAANETFDLIIVEAAIAECFLGFVPKFGSPPVIAITAYSSPPWAGTITGNPDTPSYVNVFSLPYSDHMSFTERMANLLLHSFVLFQRRYFYLPKQEAIAREFFGNSIPPITELEERISLVMVNVHHSFDYPRPMVPALVPVGGMHIKPSKALPKDLQNYLDEAKEGVIYFSLGSNVRSDQLTVEKRQILLEAFSELPYKVLWKWESDTLPGQPKNVKLGKWLPQNDILAHPNICLFITHSGLLSTQEAIYHGVPMVGMPFLADQYTNIQKNIVRGVGEKLDYNKMSKESILETVHKVLNTRSYKENMKKFSALFRDRPETPLETAVYWTEYVIRHGGAHHLRSAALDLAWYQYFLLDIVITLTIGAITVLFIVYAGFKKVFKVFWRPKKNIKAKKH